MVVGRTGGHASSLGDSTLVVLHIVALSIHISVTFRIRIIVFVDILRHVPFRKLSRIHRIFGIGVKFVVLTCFQILLLLWVPWTHSRLILLLLIIVADVFLHRGHTLALFQRVRMHSFEESTCLEVLSILAEFKSMLADFYSSVSQV